jgi:hypothetical protein
MATKSVPAKKSVAAKTLGSVPNLVGMKVMDAHKIAMQAGYCLRVSKDISNLNKIDAPTCITVEVTGKLPNITITKQQVG